MAIIPLLDEIQTIARNGLLFATSPYDQERYQRLLTIATEGYSQLSSLPAEAIAARFSQELGYITPKIGADAAVFNQRGEILLMDRSDGSGWCLPCGFVEPNEKPSQTAIRETREETGLEVEIVGLVGVFTRLPSAANGPHTLVAVVHLCRAVGGELTLSHEGLDLAYWAIDQVPKWHATHRQYASAAHELWLTGVLSGSISD